MRKYAFHDKYEKHWETMAFSIQRKIARKVYLFLCIYLIGVSHRTRELSRTRRPPVLWSEKTGPSLGKPTTIRGSMPHLPEHYRREGQHPLNLMELTALVRRVNCKYRTRFPHVVLIYNALIMTGKWNFTARFDVFILIAVEILIY